MSDNFPKEWLYLLDGLFNDFKVPITKELLYESQHEATEGIRIRIKNNQLEWVGKNKTDGWIWRSRGYLGLIQDVLDSYKVPDIDFIISLCDFPISGHRPPRLQLPVFSFCKTSKEKCILIPFTRIGRDDVPLSGTIKNSWNSWHKWPSWNQVSEEIKIINSNFSWDNKDKRCFFIGHSYAWNDCRINFCQKTLQYPDKLDGRISFLTEHSQHLSEGPLKPLIGQWVPMIEYPKYKYLMHLDGNTASERLRLLLAFDSVTIKHESPYYEFYYPLLEAGKHYVLVNEDLSNLILKLDELEDDPKLCRYISDEGMKFANETLSYQNILRYVKEAFDRYATLMVR